MFLGLNDLAIVINSVELMASLLVHGEVPGEIMKEMQDWVVEVLEMRVRLGSMAKAMQQEGAKYSMQAAEADPDVIPTPAQVQ